MFWPQTIVNKNLEYFIIFILSLLALSPAAYILPVYEVSEAREGVVVQQILNTDSWILPLRHGVIIPSKPILFHWLSASFAKFFGIYNPFVLRFASMIAASLFLVFYYVFAKRFLEVNFCYLSTAALFSTLGFFDLAIDGRVDMLFGLFVCTSIFYWLANAIIIYDQRLDYREIPQRVYLITAALAGLAFLTKGPLGLVLPAMTVFLIALSLWGIFGALSTIKVSWLLSLLIAGVWYYLAWLQAGDAFLNKHLFFENLNRFSGAAGITKKPWWFYLQHFWSMAAPWSLLLLFLPISKHLKKSFDSPLIRSLLIWISSSIFLFSLSSGKRSAYLLPILPATVLLISILVQYYFKNFSVSLSKIKVIIVSSLPLLIFVFLYLVVLILLRLDLNFETKSTLEALVLTFSKNNLLVLFLLLPLSASAFILLLNQKTKKDYFLYGIMLIHIQIVAILIPLCTSAKAITHSMQGLADLAISIIPPEQALTAIKYDYDESLDVFFFLYARKTSILYPEQIENISSGYYIVGQKYMPSIKASLDKVEKKIQILASAKRPSDEDSEIFNIFKFE